MAGSYTIRSAPLSPRLHVSGRNFSRLRRAEGARMAKKLTRTQIHGDDCGSAALRQPTCDMSFVVGGRHKQWRRAQSKANATLAPAPKIARGFTRPRDGSNVKAHLAGHMALNWRARLSSTRST